MQKRMIVTTTPLLLSLCTVFLGGCEGDTESDKFQLDSDFVYDVTGSDKEKYLAAAQGFAQLMGNDVIEMMNNSNLLFTTLSSASDKGSTTNKLLMLKQAPSPSGIESASVYADCSGGGDFRFDTRWRIYMGWDFVTPEPSKGAYAYAEGDADIDFAFKYSQCNEPQRIYNNKEKKFTVAPDQNRIMDGTLNIKLHSENELDDINNDKDFQIEGVVTLENFFYKSYTGSVEPDYLPSVASGEMSVVLRTNNVESNIYEFHSDIGMTSSYNDKNGLVSGYNRLAVKLNGTLNIDKFYHVQGYSLGVNGSQRHFGLSDEDSYRLYTDEMLVKMPSDAANNYPSSGRLMYTDTHTQLQHAVTVTATGLDFVIQQVDDTPKTGSCTWVQIENSVCVIE